MTRKVDTINGMSDEGSTTRLEFRKDGFTILTDGVATATIEWVQVREIVAYRQNPDAEDLLCLGFRADATGKYIEVNEEIDDYQTLLKKMHEVFPALKREWWQEITSSYGINWTTIYGLSLAEQLQPDPAEQYLQRVKKKKQKTRMAWMRVLLVVVVVVAAAWVQMILTRWIAPWNHFVAVSAFPIILVVLVAYFWCNPRVFFALLVGFYIVEFVWNRASGSAGAFLPDQLIRGKLSYLPVLGLEILIGMGVMILTKKYLKRSKVK